MPAQSKTFERETMDKERDGTRELLVRATKRDGRRGGRAETCDCFDE